MMPAAWLRAGLLLWLSVIGAGCRSEPGVVPAPTLPTAIDEPVSPGPPIVPKTGALAPTTRVQWPAFDGDSFWVDLPDAPQATATPADVRIRYVAPLLDALGVAPGEVTLLDPRDGIPQPTGSAAALVRIAAARVDRTPALLRPGTRRMLDAFAGKSDPDADKVLERAEGRTRAAALADLGRRAILYAFPQVVNGVPVEYAHVLASRWEGRSVNGVRGSVLTKWTVVNTTSLSATDALQAAVKAVGRQPHVTAVVPDDRLSRPAIVLLPYGRDASGRAQLRHAYRVHLTARFSGIPAPFVAWIDAGDGALLKLKPMLSAVAATGLAWERDPRDPPVAMTFDVDTAQDGVYTLQEKDAFFRLDLTGDGYNAEDVSILASSASAANFDQPAINNPAAAVCGTNKKFQQVHAFATLARLRGEILAQGMYEPYPPFGGLLARVEYASAGCNSWASVNQVSFGFCQGTPSAGCPGPQWSFAHDATLLAHELGHTATKRLMEYRSLDGQTGPGLGALEDLADFWAAHLTWTNCIGGWVGANNGGAGQGLNCVHHDEGSGFPRRLGLPADRFPDKRIGGSSSTNPCKPADPTTQPNVYCNGQIAAAALWDARLGVRSRSPLLGVPEFGVRVQAALRNLIVSEELDQSNLGDVKVYRLLQGILLELAKEYASSSSASMANKVLAGFARAGLFLAPYQCLAKPATPACAPGHPADAIIDLDDRSTANDPVIAGVKYRQSDYIGPASLAPTFHVWTGARYHLKLTTGKVDLTGTAPCHKQFMVEISTSPQFPAGQTSSSGWKNVSTSSNLPTACHGTWTPPKAKIPRDTPGTQIYYRARTRSSAQSPELISTEPGAGIVGAIPPPFALVTADGLPEF
jgi:hypothetical protein